MKKKDLVQGSFFWHEYRKRGIGGSDISAIAGINPFKKAIDVYNEKKEITSSPYISNAMIRGSHYEEQARDHHNKVHSQNFKPLVVEHDDYPFFYASLDGYDEATNQVLEIKVPSKRTLIDKTIQGQMFDYYNAQVQWQIFCSGAESAIFAVYWPETNELHEILVERDEGLIDTLKEAGVDFWLNFTQDIAPEDVTKHIELEFPDHINYFNDYLRYSALKKEGEAGMKRVKPYLLDLGDDGNWCAHGLKFTQSKGRETYDYKAMQADGINIDKYKKQGVPFCTIGEIK